MIRPPLPSTRRLLQSSDLGRTPGIPPADAPSDVTSEVVVILAALLCALICVVGLAAVARCALSRRNAATGSGNPSSSPSSNPADATAFGSGGGRSQSSATTGGASGTRVTTTSKGLKKKALEALPKLAYADAVAVAAATRGAVAGEEEEGKDELLAECAICLSEFGEREEVRVMPQCGHAFHVACVDTWLRRNSSCPSCRRPIVLDDPALPKRCRKCESIVMDAVVASSSSSAGGGGGGFLP